MQTEMSKEEVERICADGLKGAGYKTAGPTAYFRITDSIYGWVGINVSNHKEFVRVNPNIGIHCVPVMHCFDKIRGRKYQQGRIATYSVPIGEVVPDEPQIIISDRSDIDSKVGRMISYIKGPGGDYMADFVDLAVLEKALYQSVSQLGGYPEKYALTLLLNGKDKEFQEYSERQLEVYVSSGETDLIEDWRSFQRQAKNCLSEI